MHLISILDSLCLSLSQTLSLSLLLSTSLLHFFSRPASISLLSFIHFPNKQIQHLKSISGVSLVSPQTNRSGKKESLDFRQPFFSKFFLWERNRQTSNKFENRKVWLWLEQFPTKMTFSVLWVLKIGLVVSPWLTWFEWLVRVSKLFPSFLMFDSLGK